MVAVAEPFSSSSVHPLETIAGHLQVTDGQVKLFGRDLHDRESILVAFGLSENPVLLRRASNIAFCCRSPLIYANSNGRPVLSLQTCKDRMCPRCQRARGRQVSRKITSLISGYNAPRFLTLTLKHRPGEALGAMLNRLAVNFRKLRASPYWKRHVTSGVYTIETTWNARKSEWHAHLHSIIDGEFMRQKDLKALWEDVTQGSTIVHIEAVHDRERQAKYIGRYVAKPCDASGWHNDQLCEFATATHGRRMVHTFGKSHGKPVEADKTDEKTSISSCLCSVRDLLVEAKGGCRAAEEALLCFKKLGPRWCMSIGMEPAPKEEAGPAMTLEEEKRFVELCQKVASNIEERDRSLLNAGVVALPPKGANALPKRKKNGERDARDLFSQVHLDRRAIEISFPLPM